MRTILVLFDFGASIYLSTMASVYPDGKGVICRGTGANELIILYGFNGLTSLCWERKSYKELLISLIILCQIIFPENVQVAFKATIIPVIDSSSS